MPTLDSIMKQITEAQEKANKANLERYGNLLGMIDKLGQQVGAEGTFGQAEQLLSQVGKAAQTRITEQAIKAQATTEQGLISRGLGATTIRQAAKRGIRSDEERARQAAEEQAAGQKAGLLTQRAGAELQIGGMRAGAMERRADVGPDLGLYASLIQAAALTDKTGTKAATQGLKETTQKIRTSTTLGPMAMAGRTATGQQFQYGGGGGGGVDPQTGRATGFAMPAGGGGTIRGRPGAGTSRVEFGAGFGTDVSGLRVGGGGAMAVGGAGAGAGAGAGVATPSLEAAAHQQQVADVEKRGMTPEQMQAPGGVESFLGAAGISPEGVIGGKERTWAEWGEWSNATGAPIPDRIYLKFRKGRYAGTK